MVEKQNSSSPILFFKVKEPTKTEFDLFRDLVQKKIGLKWGNEKKYLLYARLQKRLKYHKCETFQSYYDFLVNEKNQDELQNLYDAVTTTKTGFYREKIHFDYLRKKIFPELKEKKELHNKKLRFWNAGCSSGEEVYTLAMEAHDFFGTEIISRGDLRILGSDVNSQVLKSAKKGEYSEELTTLIPENFLKRYFKNVSSGEKLCYRTSQVFQKFIQFRHFNLLDGSYPIATKFQLIFLRNVLYYFHSEKRIFLLRKIVEHMHKGGWLVLGITESGYQIDGMKKYPYSIYQKT